MPDVKRVSARGRSDVDNQLITLIREAMAKQAMLQKDLAAASGLSQSRVSVRLSGRGPSMPIHDLVLFCGALGLRVSETLTEARVRAEAATVPKSHAIPGYRADPNEQVNALARQLATAVWNGCDDWDYINIVIDETVRREDESFWTEKRKRWILETALAELAYSLGLRYPIRDKFPLKPPRLSDEKIIR